MKASNLLRHLQFQGLSYKNYACNLDLLLVFMQLKEAFALVFHKIFLKILKKGVIIFQNRPTYINTG